MTAQNVTFFLAFVTSCGLVITLYWLIDIAKRVDIMYEEMGTILKNISSIYGHLHAINSAQQSMLTREIAKVEAELPNHNNFH